MVEKDGHHKARFIKEYHLFSKCYRGREDFVAVRKNGSYEQMAGGLTYERFQEHIELVNTYALYQMDDSGNVSFCLFDLDVLPRKQDWEILVKKIALEKEKTRRVIQTLLSFGIKKENILIEFPTVGYHLVLSFSNPIPAHIVKRFVEITLEQSGLTETPFYPRNVDKDTFGDRVQLPFRINNNTGRRSNLVKDLESFDPENYDQTPDLTLLEKVRPVEAGLITHLVEHPPVDPKK
jgi:hypothetical protein